MSSLQSYNAFPIGGGSNYVSPSQLSEIFLKSYTVASGVSSITISDALFKLSTYKTIHVRFNNLTTTGATSTYLSGGPFKNDAVVSGVYYVSYEGISSTTATGFGSNNTTPTTIANINANIQLTPSGVSFASSIPQIDIYLTKSGMQFEYHHYDQSNNRRYRTTVSYATAPQTFGATDFAGMILGFGTGTFTGGTVSVFGVQ